MPKKIAIGIAVVLVVVIAALLLNKKQLVFGNGVEYDFDEDGTKDTAQIVVENSQGTGVFYYFVAELDGKQSQKFFIGDRIAPQSTSIDEKGIVTVAYADRKPEESFADEPSVGKSIRLFYNKKDNEFINIGSLQLYSNNTLGVSMFYPKQFTVTETPEMVKFTIPEILSANTNLSKDSYLSVEKNAECKDKNIEEAGAGNRYEEKIFVIVNTDPCLVVHYFIHYTAFENYPKGAIKEFDKVAVLGLFDSIKKTLWLSTKM
ncbi:MAG: hypothetical protein KBD47_02840 [Candidatus Pacebacteria bacterium]|nr:hypothetical protein [Candidatus Paceibacterota bacterium]